MKLIRKALIGAAALAVVASPTIALADSSALSLSRAATVGADESELDGPKIPSWVAIGLVATAIAVTVVLATEDPDSP